MDLTPGTRIGPYEVASSLGAGGMGEVYRARDTRLKREVALKILPESFSTDPDRLARFQREAEVLASLNHTNIAQIYGFEKSDETRALVIELVEGETLADRIARGPIPIDEALPIARQIAEGLEAAHEQGIIHRDLKPANIKVRPDGAVKVLDFGLAKLNDPNASNVPNNPNVTNSPTLTSPALMTGVGMLLGTAAYMSPEQAKGRTADKRSDVWAFGAVLFEMLTGRRAFAGGEVYDVLASVLAREPDWSLLPAGLSPTLATYIKRCLQKDPKQRMGDVQSIRLVLEGAFETVAPRPDTAARMPPSTGWRRAAALTGGAIVVAVIGGAVAWVATRPTAPAPLRISRLSLAPSGTSALTINGTNRDLAITPDGSRVVYVGNNGTQLFVRALDALEPVAVFTGLPGGPFVSPDGEWIGFVDGGQTLKRVAVTGGPAITIATLDNIGPRGATWASDDTIIFASDNPTTGLQRVAVAGGPTTVLTRPNRAEGEADHFWPEMLPGGRALLFTVRASNTAGNLDAAQVALLDLQTGARKVLVHGGSHTATTCRAAISCTRQLARCWPCRSTWPVWRSAAHRYPSYPRC